MEKKMADVLRGSLERLPPLNSRLVRIFISSTFTDTVLERNTLMEEVYPRIKEFCKRRYGLEFQVVDMRWGVRKEAADDHSTTALCLQEIINCQKLSLGPNFVTFLGQKHGFRPLQPQIPSSEFDKLHAMLTNHDQDTDLLDQWYWRDENSIPPVHVLQPISSLLRDEKDRKQAWEKISGELKNCLKFASQRCFEEGQINASAKHKYYMSVTEEEVIQGILSPDSDPSKSCLCFIRIIDDLTHHLSDTKAWRFIDMCDSAVDSEAQQLLRDLRDEKVAKTVQMKNVHNVNWSEGKGIDKEQHGDYLQAFCRQFYDGVTSLVESAMKEERRVSGDSLFVEVLQHSLMAAARCEIFHGREDILQRIRHHVTCNVQLPLVVYGDSGCGKTSVMAKAASQISTWVKKGQSPVVVLRFLGTSPYSSTVHKLLYSICCQIGANYDKDQGMVPWDLSELLTFFNSMLDDIPSEKPLVLVLDSLDQLSNENFAHKLNWLPKYLPANVSLIVSTLPQHFDLLSRLQGWLDASCFLNVPSLGEDLSVQVLQSWLVAKGRSLTESQTSLIQGACANCSLPLFVKLLYEKVLLWRSYTADVSEMILQGTLQESIKSLFERLENKHGHLLVQHSLSYLTASQSGLSEVELEDLLSLDDEVLDDVYQYHVPPVRRIPPLIWVRIHSDIAAYLVDKEADEMRVSFWYHRQFIEAARERYLAEPRFSRKIHSAIADYFAGTWHNVSKPFIYNQNLMEKVGLKDPNSSADRKVAAQPLVYSEAENEVNRFNKRKLNQLPYHLALAGRSKDLKEICLFSYNWLYTKLIATSIQQVLYDFQPLSSDTEVVLLQKTLNMSQSALNKLPDSLSVEISGRILPYVSQDTNNKFPCLNSLLKECFQQGSRQISVVPRLQCFAAPGGPVRHLLEHPDLAVGSSMVALSPDSQHIYALTKSNYLLMWDLETGEVEKQQQLLPLSGGKLNVMKLSLDEKFLVFGSVYQRETNTNPIVIADSVTGDIVETLQLSKVSLPLGFTDSLSFGLTENVILQIIAGQSIHFFSRSSGEFLKEIPVKCDDAVVLSDRNCAIFHVQQSNVYEIYNLTSLEKSSEIICQSTPLKLSVNRKAQQGFISFKNASSVQVVNLNPADGDVGKTVLTLNYSKNLSQAVLDVVVSQDDRYLLLLTKEGIGLWSLQDMKFVRSFLIPEDVKPRRNVLGFKSQLTPDSHLLLSTYEEYLLVWDVKSGNLRRTIQVDKSQVIMLMISGDGQYAATSSKNNNSIKIWKVDEIDEDTFEPLGMMSSSRYLDLSAKGDLLVCRSNQAYDLAVIDVNEGRVISRPSKEYDVLTPMISPDGSLVVLREYTSDEAVKVWSSRRGNLKAKIPVPSIRLKLVTISSNSQNIATVEEGDLDSLVTAKVWLADNGALLHTLQLGKVFVNQVYFAMEDSCLVMLKQSDKSLDLQNLEVALFDIKAGQKRISFMNIKRETLHVFPNDSTKVLAIRTFSEKSSDGSEQEDFVVVCLKSGEVSVSCPDLPVRRVTICGTGTTAIDAGKYVFDLVQGKRLFRFEEEVSKRFHMSQMNWDGSYAAWIALEPGIFKIGDVSKQQIISICPVHSLVMSLYISKDNIIALGCEDGRIMLLQLCGPHFDAAVEFDKTIKRLKARLKSSLHKQTNNVIKSQTSTHSGKSNVCNLF